MYEFSAPMLYSTDDINKIIDINNQVEKSKITSFYFSLPSSCELFTIFEQYRNNLAERSDFNYWKDLIKYSLDKGVDFIYNLNNPKNLPLEDVNFLRELEKLDTLLSELKTIGVNKLRVANHKLLSYLSEKYKYFSLYASTSFEFKLIKEYQQFISIHPFVKQIVPSHDVNKNFKLLENLRKNNPYIDLELIVNEGCISGCSMRFDHSCEIMGKPINIKDKYLSNLYYNKFCENLIGKNPFIYLCKSQIIYPWELKEYAKIGITKFKLTGREDFKWNCEKSIKSYLLYLKGVDDTKNIDEESINSIIHHINSYMFFNQFKIKDIKNLLPNIKYFIKQGHLCGSICGNTCLYCSKCAQNIEKLFRRQLEETEKREIPVCIC